MSSESIASPAPLAGAAESCASCGAPLDGDQRYCLECGERRVPMSSVLLGGPPNASSQEAGAASASGPGSAPPGSRPPGWEQPPAGAAPRGNAVTVIAGVGVLLLAMGVGVLIGRSGGSSRPAAAAAPQVISVSTAPGGAGTSSGASEAAFTGDWPTGTNGYTVQLQALPQASTQPSAVEAAKTAASAKGAKEVGALKSADFASLTAGSYIVYSGVAHKKADAEKALAGLKKKFPGATVIKVSTAASSPAAGAGAASGGGAAASGSGASESHPAPPKVLEEERNSKGKSFEEKSKNLPNVVGT